MRYDEAKDLVKQIDNNQCHVSKMRRLGQGRNVVLLCIISKNSR